MPISVWLDLAQGLPVALLSAHEGRRGFQSGGGWSPSDGVRSHEWQPLKFAKIGQVKVGQDGALFLQACPLNVPA